MSEVQTSMDIGGASAPSPIVVDTRLSYSSSTLLKNCEQKYYHHKVNKTKIDEDAAKRDNSHFALGSSYHYVLEMSMHTKPEDIIKDLDYCVQEIGLKEEDRALTHAMVLSNLRLRKGSKLKVIGCEYSIKDPKVIGFIDAIEVNVETGEYYISDLKTAASFYDSKLADLPSDSQLNLYCSYYKEIAEEYGLDPEKFMGSRYLVSTKSKAKQKKTETYNEFVIRLLDSSAVKSIFVTIPKELMRIEANKKEFMDMYDKSLKLREKTIEPVKNFTFCNAFFKSCDFYSQCHGQTNEALLNEHRIIVERS